MQRSDHPALMMNHLGLNCREISLVEDQRARNPIDVVCLKGIIAWVAGNRFSRRKKKSNKEPFPHVASSDG